MRRPAPMTPRQPGRWRGWAGLGIAACLGCGAPPTDTVAELELAASSPEFRVLGEGDVLPVHAGYQGGFHFEVNLRVRNLDPARIRAMFEGALEGNGTRVCEAAYPRLPLVSSKDGWLAPSDAVRCFIDDPSDLLGRRVRLVVEASDARGRFACREQVIVAGRILRPY